jgi:hypothetical protein
MLWMMNRRKRWIPNWDGAKQANLAGKKKKKKVPEAVETDLNEDTDSNSSKACPPL